MIVLFVDHASGLGGAERSLLLLLAHLDRAVVQPELATVGGPVADAAVALGVPVHHVAMPRLRRSATVGVDVWHGANALADVALRRGARLIHANTVRAALYSALAARIAGIPWLWHMRDFWLSETEPSHGGLDGMLKRLLGRSALRVVANSRAVAAHLPTASTVIHNGIDLATFDPSQEGCAFRQQWAIPPDAPLVGMVGRLRPWKGQDQFLRMGARVAARRPDARFVIVGGNPLHEEANRYTKELRRLAESVGLRDRLTFTGQLDDVRPALAAMQLMVHAGQPEPFGLVTVEAMAMAKPVVAFRHGATPELIEDGISGLLAAPNDGGALARHVLALLNDDAQRERLGRAARARAERYFDIERTVREMEALYPQILEKKQ